MSRADWWLTLNLIKNVVVDSIHAVHDSNNSLATNKQLRLEVTQFDAQTFSKNQIKSS